MQVLKWMAVAVVGFVGLLLVGGQCGWFQGTLPGDLGVRDGKLKPPSATANSVSSQARLWPDHPQREAAWIAPLALRGDGAASIAALQALLEADPGARIVVSRVDYLQVQYRTRLLNFVDDLELWFDPAASVIQVRSASRLGHRDFGVNRQRVERLRARLAAW